MRRTAVLIACFSCVLVDRSSAQDESAETGPERIRIAKLIEELGSSSYTKRQAASEELRKIGLKGRPEIETAAKSDDPDVRLRAARLLRRLNVERLWSGSPFTLVADNISASEATKQIGEQTGNQVLVGDQYGTFHDQKIQMNHRGTTFWQAVDDLCRQSGNRVRSRYGSSRPGLVFISGNSGKYPTAYAGPVRAQITAAKRVFVEEFDYEDATSETTHTFQFTVLLSWENRFRIVAHQSQVAISEAVADTPAKIFGHQASDSSWQVVEKSVQQFSTTMKLQPPPQAAKQLKRLKLSWDLIVVGEPTNLVIEDFASDTVHRQENLALHIKEMTRISKTRWEMIVALSRDMLIPEPEDILFLENEFALFDADGKPFDLRGTSRLGISDGVAKMKLTFVSPSGTAQPKQFIVTYPRIRDQRALPITFKNVSLPVARPE